MIHAFRTRLSWQRFGALFLLLALNAVALVLLLDAISSQQNAANYAQRAEQAVAASSREVTRRIRSDRGLSRMPVILLTASVQEGAATLGFEAGADDHMSKPFSPQELLVRVRSMLNGG